MIKLQYLQPEVAQYPIRNTRKLLDKIGQEFMDMTAAEDKA
jgi:hypothetical protein